MKRGGERRGGGEGSSYIYRGEGEGKGGRRGEERGVGREGRRGEVSRGEGRGKEGRRGKTEVEMRGSKCEEGK